jgi:hypothetical protein
MNTIGTAVAHPPYAAIRWRRHLFYTGLPIAMALAVFVGFAPTYYLKTAFGTPALARLHHVHGFLFTCWMLLLIAQPALVAARRTALHRKVGVVGGVLAAGMVVAAVTAGFGRWPVVGPLGPLAYFAATDLFLLAMLLHDRATRGRFIRPHCGEVSSWWHRSRCGS